MCDFLHGRLEGQTEIAERVCAQPFVWGEERSRSLVNSSSSNGQCTGLGQRSPAAQNLFPGSFVCLQGSKNPP